MAPAGWEGGVGCVMYMYIFGQTRYITICYTYASAALSLSLAPIHTFIRRPLLGEVDGDEEVGQVRRARPEALLGGIEEPHL